MAALGIEPGAFERPAVAEDPDEAYPLWPDCVDAVALFLACQTQWRVTAVAGLGGGAMIFQGLDYPGCQVAAEARGARLEGRLFEDLRVLEAAALDVLNGG